MTSALPKPGRPWRRRRTSAHAACRRAVLWLCSPGASFMVGQAVVPDGGYTVR